jgi:hypothetical protein
MKHSTIKMIVVIIIICQPDFPDTNKFSSHNLEKGGSFPFVFSNQIDGLIAKTQPFFLQSLKRVDDPHLKLKSQSPPLPEIGSHTQKLSTVHDLVAFI